jgi:hypothetical protein
MVTRTEPAPENTRLRALSVPLRPEARLALRDLATRERRTPRQQAAILLETALGVAGDPRSRA